MTFKTFSFEWKKNRFQYRMQCYSIFETIVFTNFIDIQTTMRFINSKSWKVKDHKFYDFREFNIIEIKNRIARDRKSNVSNENITKNQQAIKFFKVLLLKIIIQRCLNSLWNLKSLLNLFPLRKEIRKSSFPIKYFARY